MQAYFIWFILNSSISGDQYKNYLETISFPQMYVCKNNTVSLNVFSLGCKPMLLSMLAFHILKL